MAKFWMVYMIGRDMPTKCLETEKAARQEAERLAQLSENRARQVVVLEATEYCYTQNPPVKWEIL